MNKVRSKSKATKSKVASSRTKKTDTAKSVSYISGIKKILVPVDFSEAGESAVHYAREFAQSTGASIHLVHVLQNAQMGLEFTYVPIDWSGMRKEVNRKLGALQVEEFAGIKTTFEIRQGVAFEAIVDAAKRTRADLIIIATHGYSGLHRVILGSTTERVVRHASCPVLVVRSEAPKKTASRKKTKPRSR